MRKNIGFLKNDKKFLLYWDKNLEQLEKRENQKTLAKTNFSKNACQTYTNL